MNRSEWSVRNERGSSLPPLRYGFRSAAPPLRGDEMREWWTRRGTTEHGGDKERPVSLSLRRAAVANDVSGERVARDVTGESGPRSEREWTTCVRTGKRPVRCGKWWVGMWVTRVSFSSLGSVRFTSPSPAVRFRSRSSRVIRVTEEGVEWGIRNGVRNRGVVSLSPPFVSLTRHGRVLRPLPRVPLSGRNPTRRGGVTWGGIRDPWGAAETTVSAPVSLIPSLRSSLIRSLPRSLHGLRSYLATPWSLVSDSRPLRGEWGGCETSVWRAKRESG